MNRRRDGGNFFAMVLSVVGILISVWALCHCGVAFTGTGPAAAAAGDAGVDEVLEAGDVYTGDVYTPAELDASDDVVDGAPELALDAQRDVEVLVDARTFEASAPPAALCCDLGASDLTPVGSDVTPACSSPASACAVGQGCLVLRGGTYVHGTFAVCP